MNMLMRSIGILGLAVGLAACGSDNDNDPPEVNTVVDVAIENGNFTTLVDLLVATGLDDTLDDPTGTFTVFAPTDEAFALLGEETLAALQNDPDTLSDILLYHVVSGQEIDAAAAVDAAGTTIEMANEDEAGVSLSGEDLLINLSMVTITDVEADNGVIHVIDAVMMPPAERGEPDQTIAEIAQDTESLSTLVAALDTADLVTTLDDAEGSFTVFAPTNAAFEMLGADNVQALLGDQEALQSVLLQHVLAPGQVNSVNAYAANGTSVTTQAETDVDVLITEDRELTVGGATVTMTDIYATNGVIHVIDAVIVGDLSLPMPSIMDVARSNDDFETLVELLEATDLDMALADMENSFTVFAPTDAAFEALGQETIDALAGQPETLSNILLYHVIPGDPIMASAAIAVAESDMSTIEMGNEAMDMAGLSYVGEQLFINASTVINPNVGAGNGVIHAIDQVLMPPEVTTVNDTIAGTAAGDPQFSTLVGYLQDANLVATLNNADATFTVFAPTNAAFEALTSEQVAAVEGDADLLEEVLLSHVVVGLAVDSATAYTFNGSQVTTESGNAFDVEVVDGMLQIDGATITTFDIQTTNGVIHVIDAVILP